MKYMGEGSEDSEKENVERSACEINRIEDLSSAFFLVSPIMIGRWLGEVDDDSAPPPPAPLPMKYMGRGERRFREGERGTERQRDRPNRGPILRVLLGSAIKMGRWIGRGR